MRTPTDFARVHKLKRNKLIEYIRENYPFFRIGKDKIDIDMSFQLVIAIKKDCGYFR